MITALLVGAGFTQQVIAPADRIGGAVFYREHPDGRKQMAYAFVCSNFRISEKRGVLPWRLCGSLTTPPKGPYYSFIANCRNSSFSASRLAGATSPASRL